MKSEIDFTEADVEKDIESSEIPVKIRNEPRKKPYECSICSLSFTFKTQLKNHISVGHQGKKSEIHCKECNKSFSSAWNFQQHEKAHQKAKTDSFTCSICKKGFNNR